jgi:hypothetical protein
MKNCPKSQALIIPGVGHDIIFHFLQNYSYGSEESPLSKRWAFLPFCVLKLVAVAYVASARLAFMTAPVINVDGGHNEQLDPLIQAVN